MSNPDNISQDVANEIESLKKVPPAEKYLSLCDKCRHLFEGGLYNYHSFPELSFNAWIVSSDAKDKYSSWEAADKAHIDHAVQDHYHKYTTILCNSKNIIFHGAPGTGKTYLARQIASQLVSDGKFSNYEFLPEELNAQIEFVQFHPNYDYTDFVEGLRPHINDDGTMGFELRDGVFKQFIERARKNLADSQKSIEDMGKEIIAQDAINEFLTDVTAGKSKYSIQSGRTFEIIEFNDKYLYIYVPSNAHSNRMTLSVDFIKSMIESGKVFEKNDDITSFIGNKQTQQSYSYILALYKEIIQRKKKKQLSASISTVSLKKYVFIIDEINRGEISKIFGELFFSIDPEYRGKKGAISTQYANLHANPDERLYIPENVYIIGTMNDIDRSVDSFDFAMRRRFRFIELKANEQLEMLSNLTDETLREEAIRRMKKLNEEIARVDDLNENYQIGAAYFLKLNSMSDLSDNSEKFNRLWADNLEPLLKEYIQGMYDESGIMTQFMEAYGYLPPNRDTVDESTQN